MRFKIILILLLTLGILCCKNNDKQKYSSKKIKVSNEQNQIYRTISYNFAKLNDIESAIKYSECINNSNIKDASYRGIISIMLENKFYDDAFNLVKKIDHKPSMKNTYNKILDKMIEDNVDYDKVLTLANKISAKQSISHTKSMILKRMLSNNNINEALSFLKTFKEELTFDESYRIIPPISSYFIENDDFEGLRNFLIESNITLDRINSLSIIKKAIILNKENIVLDLFSFLDEKQKDEMFSMIANNKIIQYNFKDADIFINKIYNTEERDRVYLNYANQYILDGDIEKAETFIDSFNSVGYGDKLFKMIGDKYLQNNDVDNSLIFLNKIKTNNEFDDLASRIVPKLLFSGSLDKYSKVYDQISDNHFKDYSNKIIVMKFLEKRQYNEIDNYLNKINDLGQKDEVIVKIVRALYSRGLKDKSKFYYNKVSTEYIRSKLDELF